MRKPTVSIDLGASYTKVAYRRPLQRTGRHKFHQMNTDMVMVDGTVIIPSVMIYTGDRNRLWVAGNEAAAMTPGGKMKVFENWKSSLYSSVFNAKKVELVEAAGNFFRWLLERLIKSHVIIDDSCRVRVTIPALTEIEKQKEALLKCMKLNGWPEEIEVVVEPVANIIGVLSGGRNFVTAVGKMSYIPTFNNEGGWAKQPELNYIIKEIRRYANDKRQKRQMKISVVDFGSFTLDVANLILDLEATDYDQFPVKDVYANSWKVGVIEDIDRICFDELFKQNGIDEDRLSFYDKENVKLELYSGNTYALAFPTGHKVIGESDRDKEIVSSAIDGYCQKSWANIHDLCDKSELVVLTGGAACIPNVRDFFRNKLECKGIIHIVDFSADSKKNVQPDRNNKICELQSVDEGLERLATSVGGASIGYGFIP